jgi:hypothetical protein
MGYSVLARDYGKTRAKRGLRSGSGKRFQEMLHALGPVSTAASAMIIGGKLLFCLCVCALEFRASANQLAANR